MVASEAELAGLLGGTSLAKYELGASPVCAGVEPVLVVGPIPSDRAREALEIAQGLAGAAERWPVWVCNFGTVVGESVFWASEFARFAPDGAEITPQAMVERSLAADEEAILRHRANRWGRDIEEALHNKFRVQWPAERKIVEALERGEIPTVGEIGRWILDWRLQHVPHDPDETKGVRRDTLDYWHEESDGHIYFMPTPDPWRITAYLNFYDSGGELSTMLLKKWFDKWDATVVAHSGTMMNFDVASPPTSLAEAAEVAWEHYLVAECTTDLRGIDLSLYAHALVGHPAWSLHQKP